LPLVAIFGPLAFPSLRPGTTSPYGGRWIWNRGTACEVEGCQPPAPAAVRPVTSRPVTRSPALPGYDPADARSQAQALRCSSEGARQARTLLACLLPLRANGALPAGRRPARLDDERRSQARRIH